MINNNILYEIFNILGLKEENFHFYDIRRAEQYIEEAIDYEAVQEYNRGYDNGYEDGKEDD